VSRIGKLPVKIPTGVDVNIDHQRVSVKGTKGSLSRSIHSKVKVELADGTIVCTPRSIKDKESQALWGLSRVLIQNMVTGVSEGFKKVLEIVGVGYRAEMKGKYLLLSVGYSHPFLFNPPEGIKFVLDGTNKLIVEGIDKELVGQTAATIRDIRPPEPYKGKGIRYSGEQIIRKAGKAAGK
jgi:large subunit ribosomal protein L6